MHPPPSPASFTDPFKLFSSTLLSFLLKNQIQGTKPSNTADTVIPLKTPQSELEEYQLAANSARRPARATASFKAAGRKRSTAPTLATTASADERVSDSEQAAQATCPAGDEGVAEGVAGGTVSLAAAQTATQASSRAEASRTSGRDTW
jgi:hypothetical protein